MIGDDNMIRAHLPSDVDIEDFKAIVDISDTAPTMQEGIGFSELLYNIIEEVLEEKETKVSKAGQARVGEKISKMTEKGECDDNPKQCAAIAYSYEERDELEETAVMAGGGISVGSGPFPGITIKRRKKSKRRSKAN